MRWIDGGGVGGGEGGWCWCVKYSDFTFPVIPPRNPLLRRD